MHKFIQFCGLNIAECIDFDDTASDWFNWSCQQYCTILTSARLKKGYKNIAEWNWFSSLI